MSSSKFTTNSGMPVKQLYKADDIHSDHEENIEEPGKFAYMREIYPEMYRMRLWTIRQYTGFGTAKVTNRRFKFLVGHEQTGLCVAFDLPTQLGLHSDNPRAEGEVGRVCVTSTSIKNMEAVNARATSGEIAGVFKEEYGEYLPKTII
jgi:methylmalonyl-CoA mutase N-terminal domain/subunit